MTKPPARTPPATATARRTTGRAARTAGGGDAESGAGRRSTRRRAETRRRLIAAAYEVFTEHSIRDAPIEVICERAGFTRGAFYSNFTDKEDLFLAMYPEQMRLRLERLRAAVETSVRPAAGSSPEALTAALAQASLHFLRALAADRDWFLLTAEFRAQALRRPELRARADAVQRSFHEALAEILIGMLSRLRMTLIVDPRDAVLVLVSTYEAVLERAILGQDGSPLDDPTVTGLLPRLLSALTLPARA